MQAEFLATCISLYHISFPVPLRMAVPDMEVGGQYNGKTVVKVSKYELMRATDRRYNRIRVT